MGRETIETGRVRVRTIVDTTTEIAHADLMTETVSIERVPVNQFVETAPAPRQEGDTLVIPVIEEVAIVQTRLKLVEEVHITRHRERTGRDIPVEVRRMRAEVDRLTPNTKE